jgi:hypothetical protein
VAAQADISNVAAAAHMFNSTKTAFGGINNTGIMNLATSPIAVLTCSIGTARSI